MKCPNCQAENPDGGRFCSQCGTPLAPAVEQQPPTGQQKGGKPKRLIIIVSAVIALCLVTACLVAILSGGGGKESTPTPTQVAEAIPTEGAPTEAAFTEETPEPTRTEVPAEPTQPPATDTSVPPTGTNTAQPKPTDTAQAKPTNTAQPKPTNTPRPVVPNFGDGMWIVGTDIPPGTYRSNGGNSCYWERLGGFGGTLEEIIANDNAIGPAIVTIAATDKGFNSSRCGRWTQDLSPITSSPTAPFGDGTFLVNKDIAPGRWRSSGGSGCYWERLAGFSGELGDIIANDNPSGPVVVEISPGDSGFSSARCGTWTRIE
jgi:hypothetical protein